jgi:hypothetical protein
MKHQSDFNQINIHQPTQDMFDSATTDNPNNNFNEANGNSTKDVQLGNTLSNGAITPSLAVLGGTLGLLGGPAAPLTVPLGAFSGAAVGNLLKRSGEYLNGTKKQTPGQIFNFGDMMDSGSNAALYGTGAEAVYQIPNLLSLLSKTPSFLSPNLIGGKVRNNIIDKLPTDFTDAEGVIQPSRSVPLDAFDKALQGTKTNFVNSDTNRNVFSLRDRLLNELYPTGSLMETKSPTEISQNPKQNNFADMQDIYKNLVEKEKETKAYSSDTPEAQAVKEISTKIRTLLNQIGGKTLQDQNSVMSAGNKAQGLVKKIAPSLAIGGGVDILLRTLFGGGNNSNP